MESVSAAAWAITEAPDREGEEVMPPTSISSRAALDIGARTLLATPDALRGWLSAKEPAEVVGECKNPLHCVVSNFLKAQGVAFAAVHPTVSYVSETPNNNYTPARYIPNEPWLEKYVKTLDKSSGLITAGQALGLLPKQRAEVVA